MNHGGAPLRPTSDFFVEAPTEIGEILSAHSTLNRGETPFSFERRIIFCGIAFAGSIGIGLVFVAIFIRAWLSFGILWALLPFGVAAVVIVWHSTMFKDDTCSYVGREGVARYSCLGTRENLTVAEVFRFRDAAELQTSLIKRYWNGVHVGTDYSFTWTNVAGLPCYTISGTHRTEKGVPPSGDPFHYGSVAEAAWTVYLLAQVQLQIRLSGSVSFKLEGGWIRLAPEGISFDVGGQAGEWAAGDIASAKIEFPTVRILRRDAQKGWFSSTGIIKVPVGRLANLRLFLLLLERMVGVPLR
jgi:hypothetical protein